MRTGSRSVRKRGRDPQPLPRPICSHSRGLTLCPPTGPDKHQTLHKTRIHFFQLSWECGIACLLGEQDHAQPCRLSLQQYSLTNSCRVL
jgi:hypothetical protein